MCVHVLNVLFLSLFNVSGSSFSCCYQCSFVYHVSQLLYVFIRTIHCHVQFDTTKSPQKPMTLNYKHFLCEVFLFSLFFDVQFSFSRFSI